MKKLIIVFILLIHVNLLFSQAPVVSNVSFSQRTDGSLIVDIYYDLSDTDGETKKIVIEASNDGGSSWTLPCNSITGDVGAGVALGTGKHAVWDFHADNPDQSGSNYKIRVTASEVGTMTGNDGKTYATVKIGTQWWMAENLRETEYRDNSAIPVVTDNDAWKNLSTDARCAYNNDEPTSATYGYLYNWYAVNNAAPADLAPAGWHVPTDDEWTTLITYLGGTAIPAQYKWDVAGGKLKEEGTTHWNTPNTGATDEFDFTALPGGYRYPTGTGSCTNLGVNAFFWASVSPRYRQLWSESADIYGYETVADEACGYSVRLIKD